MTSVGNIDAAIKTWADVRDKVHELNPEFAALVDEVSPDKSMRLYQVKYQYGDRFLKNGQFYLPTKDGDFTQLSADMEPASMRDDLAYSIFTNPVMMSLDKKFELYIKVGGRLVPFMLVPPGAVFGLSRILDEADFPGPSHASKSLWSIAAGARSTFMLPKISDNTAHQRLLKHFGVTFDKPRDLQEHWHAFRNIARSPNFSQSWRLETLLFSANWFKHINDPAWRKLKIYLLQQNRRAFSFWHHIASWQVTFSRIQYIKHIKASPHMIDTIKHLFMMASGSLPGFRPETDDSMVPVAGIQEAYIEHYGLQYTPTIMTPHLMQPEDTKPIYYSLQQPTAVEYSPKSSGGTSTIHDLDELHLLMQKYTSQILKQGLNQEGTILEATTQKLKVSYFHTTPGGHDSIEPADQIPKEDPDFGKIQYHTDNRLAFARNSSFMKGCVRLKIKQDQEQDQNS